MLTWNLLLAGLLECMREDRLSPAGYEQGSDFFENSKLNCYGIGKVSISDQSDGRLSEVTVTEGHDQPLQRPSVLCKTEYSFFFH